jgi:hypothetical protein
MARAHQKYFIGGIVLLVAVAIVAAILFYTLHSRPSSDVLVLSDSAAPSGWYAHHLDIISSSSFLILTRDPILPVRNATEMGAYGEQIDVDVATTTFSPNDYIANEGFFGDPAGSVLDSSWSTLGGRPLFVIRGESAEGESFKAEFLFAGDAVYSFNLYPDDAKDYGDLQKVVDEVARELP